jgi:hypothetical protein
VGGTGDKYDLKIVRDDASGEAVFDHHGVSLSAGESEEIDYGGWDGKPGEGVSVAQDDNGDGTWDETGDLSDES